MERFPFSETCAFCKIIRSQEKAYIVFEDGISLAFLDRRPLFPGHCLLVPKGHYETLVDLPAWLVGPLFQNAQLLERAIEEGLQADGTFIAINNHVSQSVPHVHVHLVPRHQKDGLKGFFWPRQRYRDEDAILQVQETLRSAITSSFVGTPGFIHGEETKEDADANIRSHPLAEAFGNSFSQYR